MSGNNKTIDAAYIGGHVGVNTQGCGIFSRFSSRPNHCPLNPPCHPSNPCDACGGGQQYQNQIGEEIAPINNQYYNQEQPQYQQAYQPEYTDQGYDSGIQVIQNEDPTKEFQLTAPENRKEVIVYGAIEGSLEDFASNPELTKIKIPLKAFKEIAAKNEDVSRALLLSLVREQSNNTFPVDVSLNVAATNPCDNKNDSHVVGVDGAKHGIVLIANHVSEKEVPFLKPSKDIDNVARFQDYAHITPEILRNGISPMDQKSYSLVTVKHPMINLLRKNHERIGTKIDDLPKAFGEFHAIDNTLIEECIEHIEKNIIGNLPYRDLNEFEFILGRPDGEEWNSTKNLKNVGDRSAEKVIRNILTTTNVVSFTIKFTVVYAPINQLNN